MSLNECIRLTIKKHPDYTCEAILNHYFNSNDVNCFSAKVDGKFPR